MRSKLMGANGPLGVFVEYPILLRLAGISVCAEIAWATLLAVLQFHFQDDLFQGQAQQLIASRIASVTFAFVAMETLFKVPMGALADRFGPRRLIFFALSVSTLSPLLMMFATKWYQFVPLRALDGLGAAALWPAMSSLMALSVPREAKAAAMSVFNGAYCLGLAAGPVAGLSIGYAFGNVRVFPLCALLMAFGLLISWLVLRGGVGDKAAASAHKPHLIGEDFPSQGNSILKGRPLLVRMMVIYALSQAAVGMFANVMIVYVGHQFGIKEAGLPKLIAVPALFVAFIALPLGRLGDSIGRAKAVWISYIFAAAGMLCVALTSLMGQGESILSPPLMVFGLGLLLLIASYILGTPAWLGLTSVQVSDAQQARALSLMQTAQGVGVVIGSALVASGGHLLTTWHRANDVIYNRLPRLPRFSHPLKSYDTVPITVWLWAATAVFALCLLLTLLFVREPEHSADAEAQADPAHQPLEMTGF